MKFTKYFSDTKRLLQFTLEVIEAHCPELFVLDVWTDCVKCTGMDVTCILPDQVNAVKSICLAYKEAVSEFIRLVVHYDICDYHECLVDIKAEMHPASLEGLILSEADKGKVRAFFDQNNKAKENRSYGYARSKGGGSASSLSWKSDKAM